MSDTKNVYLPIGTMNASSNKNDGESPYTLSRDARIAVIGAGVAGIATAAALTTAGYKQILVYEKNDGLGGVWHHNYPGASGK